jgi:hypothetical protein
MPPAAKRPPTRIRGGTHSGERRSIVRAALLAWAALCPAVSATADEPGEPTPITLDDPLPYGQPPIDYFGSPRGDDAVSRLQTELSAGRVDLDGDGEMGYLRSLLGALDVPLESQTLVFTKTALNPDLVTPSTPRAVYFNDETAVGWVPGAAALEVIALDPLKGPLFYTLNQPRELPTEPMLKDADPPQFRRERRCLACHAGPTALRVPGGVVRSFLPDREGNPETGYSRVDHTLDFAKRFGGWYVTGRLGEAAFGTHLGNTLLVDDENSFGPPRRTVADMAVLVERERYPSPHSDVVAHLVLQHQMHGWNLLTRVGYESRLGQRSDAEEQLLRYLLFIDEAPLPNPLSGDSGFAEAFAKRGPTDSRGRSLREFDLKTRLFRYRMSYLIYSPLFDGLPDTARQRLARRLQEILTAPNPPAPFDRLPLTERTAIWEILTATKPALFEVK